MKAVYSIIFVSRGFLKVPKPLTYKALWTFRFLFPLDCAGGFGGDVVDNAVDVGTFVCYAVADLCKNVVRYSCPIGCHKVVCGYCSDYHNQLTPILVQLIQWLKVSIFSSYDLTPLKNYFRNLFVLQLREILCLLFKSIFIEHGQQPGDIQHHVPSNTKQKTD